MTRSHVSDAGRAAARYLGPAALAATVGLMVAHGRTGALLAAAIGGGLALVLAVEALGFRALTVWLVVGVIAYPFVRFPQQHAEVTFDRMWLVSLMAALLITKAPPIRRSKASRRLTRWIVLLVAAFLVRAALTNVQQRYQLELVVDTLVLPAILFFSARRFVTTSDRWDRLAGAFTAAGAILGAVAAGEWLSGFQLAKLSGGSVSADVQVGFRVSGPYATDDALAVALLMCLAATLLWLQASPKSRRRVGILVVSLELAGITFTFFRGAWIAAVVVMVVAIGLRPHRYARLLGTAALMAAVAGAVFVGSQNTSGLAARLDNTQNINGRLATYIDSLDLFGRHPATGVGISQFGAAQTKEVPATEVNGVAAVTFPHSSYLEALSEGGLLLFVPLLAVTVAAALMIRRYRRLANQRRDVLIGATMVAAGLAWVLVSLEETVIVSSTASNAFLAVLLGACAGRLDFLEHDAETSAVAGPESGRLVS